MSANLIDIDKPVKIESGCEVIELLRVGEKLEGFIKVADGEVFGPIAWSLHGHGMTPGYRDGRFKLRNVPERVKINPNKPVQTTEGCPVRLDGVDDDGRMHGQMLIGSGGSYMSWNAYGHYHEEGPDKTAIHRAWDIVNVPEPVEQDEPAFAEIEAARIEDFRQTIQNYVEIRLGRVYDPSRHGEMQLGSEVGFVRLTQQNGDWEVWDLCDDLEPIDIIPYPIPGEEVSCFWNWVRDREEQAEDRGRKCGFQDGTASFQRRLADLCGFNPNKF